MWPRRISNQIVLAFVAMVLVSTGSSGVVLYWRTQESLKKDLEEKLIAIAHSIATQINMELLKNLAPGDENTRTYVSLRSKLNRIKEATGVQRIYIFDKNRRSMVDTDTFPIGGEYVNLKFSQTELERVFRGQGASSVLFEDRGEHYKSGFAPLLDQGQVKAAIGVDASAAYLETLRDFERQFVLILAVSVIAIIAFSLLFARSLTAPISQLVQAARLLEKGNHSRTIRVDSKSEIGILSQAMEQMRLGILRRDQELKTMLANVAHEIKNPLGGIEIFAGLLNDRLRAGSEEKEYLDKIVAEARKLNTIINNYLEYARPVELKKERFRLADLVTEVTQLMAFQMKEKRLQVIQELASEEVFVMADREQIKRSVLNLLKNSMAASKEGGTITISASRNRTQAEIRIVDEGIGIPEEHMGKIFDPFFTTKEDGTGLGLAIVKKMVEENGGTVKVESGMNSGSIITLTLTAVD